MSAVTSALPNANQELIVVLVNSADYGGAGGQVAWTTSDNELAYEIALHEIGHSYARLQDEYVDPEIAANYPLLDLASVHVETTSDPNLVPWEKWVGYTDSLGTVGVYEGGYYRSTGVWRATLNDKMLELNKPFSAPEKEAFIKQFYMDVGSYAKLESLSPLDLFASSPSAKLFKFDWFIDSQPISIYSDRISVLDKISAKADGEFSIKVGVSISDNAEMIRDPEVIKLSTKYLEQNVSGFKLSVDKNGDFLGAVKDDYVVVGTNFDNTFNINFDGGRNSYIRGSGGDDKLLVSGNGDFYYDGGSGFDTIQYSNQRSVASIFLSNDLISISKIGSTAKLIGIERIDFIDGDLIFDVESANAPAAYRLYGGAFDRTPDEGGFRFWTSYLDKNASLHTVATEFIRSPEFIARYGASLSNAAFVDALYQNVLSRDGDTGGIAYWNQQLDTKARDRPDVLVQFTQLPEFVGISAANITNGYWVV